MLCTIGIDHSGWSSLNGRLVVPIHFIDVITVSACSLKVKLKVAFVLQFHLYSTLYSARSASIFFE